MNNTKKSKNLRIKKFFVLFLFILIFIFLFYDIFLVFRFINIKRINYEIVKEFDYSISNKMYSYSEYRTLIYEPPPNTQLELFNPRHTIYKTNSDRFRGREYSIEKPNGTYRIILLGDSYAFGLHLDENETLAFILEKALNEKIRTYNFEVLNFGVYGYNLKQEIERLKLRGLKYSPDLVILWTISNDIEDENRIREIKIKILEYCNKTNKICDKNRLDCQARELAFKEALNNIDQRLKQIKIVLKELEELSEDRNFSVIILYADTGSSNFLKSNTQIKKYLGLLNESSKKYGWYFLELNNKIEEIPLKERIVSMNPSDFHPSPKCSELISEQLFDFMIKNKIFK